MKSKITFFQCYNLQWLIGFVPFKRPFVSPSNESYIATTVVVLIVFFFFFFFFFFLLQVSAEEKGGNRRGFFLKLLGIVGMERWEIVFGMPYYKGTFDSVTC